MYVTAMNRLRAAYVDLDPGMAPYLMAAYHDDQAGADTTYFFFGNRSTLSHIAGSSMIFMNMANAALIAILAGLLLSLFGAGTAAAVVVGAVAGLAFLAACSLYGYRGYTGIWRRFTPVSPTPPGHGD
jgi:fatty acid desaturase